MGIVETYLIGPFAEMAAYPAGVLETVIAGIGNGFLYGLVAIGFVIIFKSSGVFNYAQGAVVFFAALNFAGLLTLGLPWYLAGLLTLLLLVALAFAVERTVLRLLVGQSALTLFMATIGVSFFIEGLVEAAWGGNPHLLKIGLPESALFTIDHAWGEAAGLDIIVQESDLLAIAVGLVLVLALYAFFHRSRIGQALRAVADDHMASMSVGIPLNRMWVIVWSLSGLTAFVAATVWGTKIQIEPTMIGLALKALPVLILGGLTSIPGALVGGCIIGVSELLFETYWGQPLFGGATTEWFAYVLALVFLLFRPQGLFGEPIIERV
ncbi:MAG TPA: branched-chain amino acid ABC transporter permease [Geminicoccaceae bacterium]|nr:branched-chain amino acid ABC transporter permease [Geminicoccaceae bacterium]